MSLTGSDELTPAERERFAALADVMIPEADGMMSASQADVAGEYLDRVLNSRPDVRVALRRVLREAEGQRPSDFLEKLQQERSPDMWMLAEIVPGTYFLNPAVRAMIGYEGQTARPIDPRADYMEDGLLASVIQRGRIYRPTPDPTEASKRQDPHD